jgi:hypothetical protein
MKKHNYKKTLKSWKLKAQECKGNYFFDGQMYMTSGINEKLTVTEISQIIACVKNEVQRLNGADYLFVFAHKKGKIFVIDNLNAEMKRRSTDEFIAENNYFTILFSEEY